MSSAFSAFSALGLAPALCRAAADLGYAEPTPVQAAAIPAVLQRRDLVGAAPTGSGKTAAFALPLLQGLSGAPLRGPRPTQVLVLVPTRELALQVGGVFEALARHAAAPVRVVTAFGGVSANPQMLALRGGADIVVATPGRLLDLLDQRALRLDGVNALVLDEADRLLDAGFADELARVLQALPARRQQLLFSATFPAAVQALVDTLLRDPLRIELAADSDGDADTPPNITQRALQVDAGRRTALLHHLIVSEGWPRTLVFVASRHACDHVATKLIGRGLTAAALHGDLSQGARTRQLDDFKAGRLQVLVATDLAARGLHIDALPVVVNHDLARSPTDHVHRIGRTGRAGAAGLAVSFVSAAGEAHFRLIEKRMGQRVPREVVAGFEPVETAPATPGTGGVKGRRPSKKDRLRAAARPG